MRNLVTMRLTHSFRYLLENRQRLLRRYRTVLLKKLGQSQTMEKLGHQVGFGLVDKTEIEEGDDVGVFQAGKRLSLPLKPFYNGFARLGRLVRLQKEFDRHFATGRELKTFINDTHRTATDNMENAVPVAYRFAKKWVV